MATNELAHFRSGESDAAIAALREIGAVVIEDLVPLHPLALATADAIIGPNYASYTLNLAHMMIREPGAPRQWIHRGRPGIHLSYVAGWLRPEENNTLATPPDVARNLPRRTRQLVGYGIHDALDLGGGHLGCVDLRDPSEMLVSGDL